MVLQTTKGIKHAIRLGSGHTYMNNYMNIGMQVVSEQEK
jgi:hypothetical protein